MTCKRIDPQSTHLPAAQSSAPPDIEATEASFARQLRAGNKIANTIRAYLEASAPPAAFLAAHGMPCAVGAIHREHLEAFIEDQLVRLKPASVANRYRSLQQFFRWLVDEGEIRESPGECRDRASARRASQQKPW
jgi:site-specific recombinase XerD